MSNNYDNRLVDLLQEQYGLTEDRGRRAFFTFLAVSIVLVYVLHSNLPLIVIPGLSIEVNGFFAQVFGPLALVLVVMNYHYLSAYTCIALGRFVKTAQATGGAFAELDEQDLKILVKRRSLAGKLNPYAMGWFYKIPKTLSVPKYLWFVSESFWMICILILNIFPIILYCYATYSLLHSTTDIPGQKILVYIYIFLGLGLLGAPLFWFYRVRGSKYWLQDGY